MRAPRNQRRVRKGISTGGQYATQRRDEADADLSGDLALLQATEEWDESAAQERSIDKLLGEMGFKELEADEAYRIAESAVRRHQQDHSQVTDMTQDTIVEYLKARDNARTKLYDSYINGSVVIPGSVLQNPGAYIHRVAFGLEQRARTGADQSSDRAAIKLFRQAVTEMSQNLGRDLTQVEKDLLANEIRESQPPGRRARKDFHITFSETPMGVHADSDDADSAQKLGLVDKRAGADGYVIDGGSTGMDDFSEGSIGDELLTKMSEGHSAAVLNAKRRAWDALAERSGAPLIAEATVAAEASSAARKTIAAGGGVAAVCRRFQAEKATAEEARAVLLPFGGAALDHADQENVVSTLLRVESHAEDLFNASLGAATIQKKRQRATTMKGSQ